MKILIQIIILNLTYQQEVTEKTHIRPKEKICKGLDAYRRQILSFKIEGSLEGKQHRIYIQENQKVIQHIEDIKNIIVYEVKYGGIVQICISNKEKTLPIFIQLKIQKGLMLKEFDENKNDETTQQEIQKFEKQARKIYKQVKDLVHQQELEYIFKRTLIQKILDSLKGKNNQRNNYQFIKFKNQK